MSKSRSTSYIKILLLMLALQIFTEARAQDIAVGIDVDAKSGTAHVSGRFQGGFRPEAGEVIRFRTRTIGDERLGERISGLKLSSETSVGIPYDLNSRGALLAAREYSMWEYSIALAGRPNRAAAHSSWLHGDGGVLMLDDLLPIFGGDRKRLRAGVYLRLPVGWRVFPPDDNLETDQYDVADVEGSVIFIGKRYRTVPVRSKSGGLSLLIKGQWIFTDEEAGQMAGEIFDAYTKMIGPLPVARSTVALLKFPGPEAPGHWEAETRGSTVTVVSSDMPFKTQSQQRLHEQLRHEIFHLWFPNAVNLTGDYTWFYEGFALYQSLKLGVSLKRIRFEDFLDTLSRAYTIDSNSKPPGPFTTSSNIDPTLLYARGMVIAFLTDLRMLRASGGKRDTADDLRELFARHKMPAVSIESTAAVRKIVGDEVLQRYILAAEPIDWAAEVGASGFESVRTGRTVKLQVSTKPEGRQKAILKRLGYN